jgi:septum formation protein
MIVTPPGAVKAFSGAQPAVFQGIFQAPGITMARVLVLASGSRYRRELLTRLGLPFSCDSPDIDESILPGEAPAALASRLARQKALAVAERHPQALVIGSDQVADCGGLLLSKPGTPDNARQQLRQASGKTVTFWTALALAGPATSSPHEAVVRCDVHFRELTDDEIDRYIAAEQPLDCAGSFKAEGLGIILFRKIVSDDPTALIGLPLIALCGMLRAEGIELPPRPPDRQS